MRDVDDALPGADLIREGLRDLQNGVESVPALLVLVGAPRLASPDDFIPELPGWQERRFAARVRKLQ